MERRLTAMELKSKHKKQREAKREKAVITVTIALLFMLVFGGIIKSAYDCRTNPDIEAARQEQIKHQ